MSEILQDDVMFEYLEHAPTTIFMMDEDANVLYCNQHAMNSFGIRAKDAFGVHFFSRFSPKFQSNIIAKDYMRIQIGKAMNQGMSRFLWTIKRDLHESSASIRLIGTHFEGAPCVIAYLAEFDTRSGSFFDEPLEASVLDDSALSVFDAMPNVWTLVDTDLNCLECNMATVRFFGANDKKDFIERYTDIFPEFQPCGTLTIDFANARIEQVLREGTVVFEMDQQTFDGEVIPTEVTLVRTGLKNRFILSSFLIDLREQRALEQSRSLEEARVHAILKNSPLAIHLWSRANEMLFCNDKMADIFGFESVEEYQQKFLSVYPKNQPDGRDSLEHDLQILHEVIETGKSKALEWTLLDKDGKPVLVERSFYRLNYGDDYAVLEFCRDLRPERAAQEMLMKENERFKRVFDNVPAICTIWSEHREIVLVNSFGVKLFGLSSTKEYLDNFYRLSPEFQPCGTPSGDMAHDYVEAAFSSGYAAFDWMHQNLEGEQIPTHVILMLHEIDGRPCVLGFATDQRALLEREGFLESERERFRHIFDLIPSVCTFWEDSRTVVMCNKAAVDFFGIESVQYFLDNTHKFAPLLQPCGQNSIEMIFENTDKAYETGYAGFHLIHTNLKGEIIPSFVEFFRAEVGGRACLIGFTTDRRAALEREELLRLDSERFDLFFSHSPTVCSFWDEEYGLMTCNDALLTLFGIDDMEFFLVEHAKFSPAAQPCGTCSYEKRDAYIKQAYETGHVGFDWVHQNIEGEPIPVFIEFTHVKLNGRSCLIGFTHDKREQLAREAAFKLELGRLNAIFENIPVALQIWNEDRQVIFANKAMAGLYKISDIQEFIQKNKVLYVDTRPDGFDSLENCDNAIDIAFETGFHEVDWISTVDGEDIPLECVLMRIDYGGQNVVLELCKDMRQELLEKKLHQANEDKLRIFLEYMPIPSIILDLKFNVLEINAASVFLFGFQTKKAFMKSGTVTVPEFQPDGVRTYELFASLLEIVLERGEFSFECNMQDKNGVEIPCQITAIATELSDERVIMVFMQDLRVHFEAIREQDLVKERVRAMLDASPNCCFIIDTQGKVLDCNLIAYEFFGVSDLNELNLYVGNMHAKAQPGGLVTKDIIADKIRELFDKEQDRFEWHFRNTKGDIIPSEVSSRYMSLGGQRVVILYVKDMREHLRYLAEVKRSQEMVLTMVNMSPIACIVTDENHNVLECNQMALELFGVKSVGLLEFCYDIFCSGIAKCGNLSCEGNLKRVIEKNLEHEGYSINRQCNIILNGELVPVEITGKSVPIGNSNCFVMYIGDLRETRRLELEQIRSNERVTAILNSSPVASFIVDSEYNVTMTNRATRNLLGMEPTEMIADYGGLFEFLPDSQPDGRLSKEKLVELFDMTLKNKNEINFEWMWKRMDLDIVPSHVTLQTIEINGEDHIIGHAQDLRQLKKATEAAGALEKMAYTDPLTGVYNRRYLKHVALTSFESAMEHGNSFTVLMIDVDDFKPVNDTYGHNVGDEVLRILISRMEHALRRLDVIVRYGGEEFVVLMPGTSLSDGAKVACRIQKYVNRGVFATEKHNIPITVSIGMSTKDAFTPKDPIKGLNHIIDNADKAMYVAKREGKNLIQSFSFENAIIERVICELEE
ncbi:MAG: PAS domain S-box protein [Defluviitaleaceae bacterium]|nr:PAS domain S-box protein [Defluviitaleaceae bacterium]